MNDINETQLQMLIFIAQKLMKAVGYRYDEERASWHNPGEEDAERIDEEDLVLEPLGYIRELRALHSRLHSEDESRGILTATE